MISSLGVQNVSVEEIYSLDVTEQERSTSFGLVFLFKHVNEHDGRATLDSSEVPDLFFARQVVQNACATQAILSVLLNSQDIDIGPELSGFKLFTIALDSESRGYAIGNSDSIRKVHNSFARADPFFIEESKAAHGDKDEAFHFVAYIPYQGRVYE
jgi:ubiquitin carboxyl-terminal hydrolase L5